MILTTPPPYGLRLREDLQPAGQHNRIRGIQDTRNNSAPPVILADAQLQSALATQASARTTAEVLRTVNPAAAVELDRRDELTAKVQACCPPDPRPPLCEYEPCKDPGPYRESDPKQDTKTEKKK